MFGPLTLSGNKKHNSFPSYSSAMKFYTACIAGMLAFDVNRLKTFKYFDVCGRVILGNLGVSELSHWMKKL